MDNFWTWIYVIGSEKKNGLTPEEAGLKFIAFWGSQDWVESPAFMMRMEKQYQARYPGGFFEVLEESAEKVSYRAKKTWLPYFGNEDQIMNVSREDMTRFFKATTEATVLAKGWSMTWEETEEMFTVTITGK